MNVLIIATAGYTLRSCAEEGAGTQIDLCPPTPAAEYIKDSPQIQTPRILYEQIALPYQRDCD